MPVLYRLLIFLLTLLIYFIIFHFYSFHILAFLGSIQPLAKQKQINILLFLIYKYILPRLLKHFYGHFLFFIKFLFLLYNLWLFIKN
jgi:hypothetical protein